MTKLLIDRDEWARGQRGDGIMQLANLLYSAKDHKKCCVGIYASARGVDNEVLADNGTCDELSGYGSYEDNTPLPEDARWLLKFVEETGGYKDSEDAMKLYKINDDATLTESEREAQIAKIFAAHNVEVEFVN